MSQVLADIPEVSDQHAFNLARWGEVLADSFLNSLEYRIETNGHGRTVMMPPPGFRHSELQGLILAELYDRMPKDTGQLLFRCPVSTAGGVKGVDVVWVSHRRVKEGLRENVLTIAPEI